MAGQSVNSTAVRPALAQIRRLPEERKVKKSCVVCAWLGLSCLPAEVEPKKRGGTATPAGKRVPSAPGLYAHAGTEHAHAQQVSMLMRALVLYIVIM